MSHLPQWAPKAGRADVRHLTKVYNAQEMPAHTRLKFRTAGQGYASGSGTTSDVQMDAAKRRDLKLELERAERQARDKKRKDAGELDRDEQEVEGQRGQAESPMAIEQHANTDEEAAKRRKMVEAAASLERADSDSESAAEADENGKGKDGSDSSTSDSDSDSDSDEEDETAALMRELEKIKRERAEEKARVEAEKNAAAQDAREDEIALGNPLLNLENAMKGGGASKASSAQPSFGVKRRWDDDVIFKNQAAGNDGGDKSSFVNDLTRSEFHKKFLNRYIR
ncbi:Uncharacterized conserved protein [Ceraceosorus bombacis]|uniref:Uncharacterized conserved protein n=1 Tax=Ceraceosorus bombacis TaxID=401625 RepID=A0A0N7LAC3_9BASI|nr:Uncharacterized conserved protein [Ceraceosorus bombacis]